jgi:hypothetical protein
MRRLLSTNALLCVALFGVLAWSCGGHIAANRSADASSVTVRDGEDASSDTGSPADAGSCMISASNYDQSCNVDTDCREVSPGDYCSPICRCGGAAIHAKALAQFNEDVSKTPLGSGALGSVGCYCPFQEGPCCRRGTCVGERGACSAPTDTLPACSDAGGTCVFQGSAPVSGLCAEPGPPDACAYSDEICCTTQ